MKLTKLIIKNFRVIMRSRISSLIIIFGPLLLMLLAGYAFNNSATFDLNVGVYTPHSTDLTSNFTASLAKQFNLLTYTNEFDCITDVRNLKLHSCLVFSDNFVIAPDSNNTITINVDNSKVNIVDLIQNALNKVITVQSSQIGSDLAGVLIANINDASTQMDLWRNQSIAAIQASNQGLSASIDTDKSKWSSLSLDYTPSGPVLDDFTISQQNIKVATNQLLTITNNLTTLTQQIIDDVGQAAPNGNITIILHTAKTSLDALTTTVASNANTSTDSITAFDDSVQKVTDLINQLSTVVSHTVTLRTDLVKRFDLYKQQLSAMSTQTSQLSDQINAESTKLKNIKVKDASTIVSPVHTVISPVVTSVTKLSYIFPSLMMLVIMFVCVMLSATIVVIEKLSPAKFRLFTTPTSDIVFITSNFFTTLIVAVVQIILMLCIASFVFHLDLFANILNTSAILFIGAIVFTLLGMCLGYIFANEQTTILAAISLGSAFILVSDLILPIESIATNLRGIIAQTPFVLLTSLLRRTILFGANIKSLGAEFYIIIIYCVSLFAVIVIAHKLLKVFYLVSSTKKAKKKA